jgi:hypothetical protein
MISILILGMVKLFGETIARHIIAVIKMHFIKIYSYLINMNFHYNNLILILMKYIFNVMIINTFIKFFRKFKFIKYNDNQL